MPRASTPRLAPGFTLPTRRTFILPGSEPITDTRHLLDQTNEYVVRALNSSYPASIQPTNRTHHLHGYNTRSWFLSTRTWSSQVMTKSRWTVTGSGTGVEGMDKVHVGLTQEATGVGDGFGVWEDSGGAGGESESWSRVRGRGAGHRTSSWRFKESCLGDRRNGSGNVWGFLLHEVNGISVTCTFGEKEKSKDVDVKGDDALSAKLIYSGNIKLAKQSGKKYFTDLLNLYYVLARRGELGGWCSKAIELPKAFINT
ncbi:hypothetical protein DFH27DRAFT_630695 [Peziza echinospora]|nr:hypothetical protein DFH27DRAFT_630695 [Peziza echinospora]